MLLGWLIVAALEWAAWRDEPHYGSGLPPRYYVPTVNLPPARPLEQVPAGYPEAQRDEAPTWIASAALRAEMLGEWPHSAPVEDARRTSRRRTRRRSSRPSRCRRRWSMSSRCRLRRRSQSRSRAGTGACGGGSRRLGRPGVARRPGRRARRRDGGFAAAARGGRRRARAGPARRRARALAAGDRAVQPRPARGAAGQAAVRPRRARPSRCPSSRCRPARTAFGRFPAARPVRISV